MMDGQSYQEMGKVSALGPSSCEPHIARNISGLRRRLGQLTHLARGSGLSDETLGNLNWLIDLRISAIFRRLCLRIVLMRNGGCAEGRACRIEEMMCGVESFFARSGGFPDDARIFVAGSEQSIFSAALSGAMFRNAIR